MPTSACYPPNVQRITDFYCSAIRTVDPRVCAHGDGTTSSLTSYGGAQASFDLFISKWWYTARPHSTVLQNAWRQCFPWVEKCLVYPVRECRHSNSTRPPMRERASAQFELSESALSSAVEERLKSCWCRHKSSEHNLNFIRFHDGKTNFHIFLFSISLSPDNNKCAPSIQCKQVAKPLTEHPYKTNLMGECVRFFIWLFFPF